jgi:hypothetical protein
MPHESMLTVDELDQMDDLSGSTLYSAEVKRIPFLTNDEQADYIEAARNGDETARQRLLLNCLNWTMTKAASIFEEREPAHSDLMDLVGHANVKLCEALDNALTSSSPVKYLMSVAALEMKFYCIYHDQLVMRSRNRPVSSSHPVTVSIEQGSAPPLQTIAGPDVQLTSGETSEGLQEAEYQIVHDAIRSLSDRRLRFVRPTGAARRRHRRDAQYSETVGRELPVPGKTPVGG